MMECPFCNYNGDDQAKIVLENEHCIYLQYYNRDGKGMIIPKKHKESVFDLNEEEWHATYELLLKAKSLVDQEFKPDGYNVGWNVGKIGGQSVFHAHLHIVPRYKDEPYAGKGINHWIKSEENKRSR